MEARHKILILDDDPELLVMYEDILGQLSNKPEILTANSGARAMALLEAEPVKLLICDLKMPKMDGLQVLSIVRRKYPEIRTVVLTAVMDEQFRSRVYALGVDLFWQKPAAETEIKMFLECLESLLGREAESGFRGVQSKSLMDIIQLECISQSSSLLRIANGTLNGKIWINAGEIIDSEVEDLTGEPAFHRILSWRAGTFEMLPAETSRPRTIFNSYSALLLESAQAQDESRNDSGSSDTTTTVASPLAQLSKVEGVEFVLAMRDGEPREQQARGLENPEIMSTWSRQMLQSFNELGDRLQAGTVEQIECLGSQRHVALATQADTVFCVGWKLSMTTEQIREMMRKVLSLWAS